MNIAGEKTVAIVQSSYIPWKGYFDLINLADEFVLLDTAQYTRRDWRNRNRIKTPTGVAWLTIPVEVKGKYEQSVQEVRIADSDWAPRHWETLRHNYAAAPCFGDHAREVESWYEHAGRFSMLSEVNHFFLTRIAQVLGVSTPLTWSKDYPDAPDPSARLAGICAAAGATRYLSGPSARAYLDESEFRERGIEVSYMDYSGYREYRQQHGPFRHDVTVLDLIFNEGVRARSFLKSVAERPTPLAAPFRVSDR